MKNSKARVILLIAIFAAVVILVLGTSGALLYRTAVDMQVQRLKAAAELRIRMIELEIEHGASNTQRPDPRSLSAVEEKVAGEMRKINDASYHGVTMPVEFVWGRREGADIVFLLPLRHSKAKSIPFNSRLSEPMRLALNGQTGTIIGLDYRGEKVLSAYAPLYILGRHYGIVAKIDMSGIRAPFIRVGAVALFLAITAILAGAFAFIRITNPILIRIQESENKYRGLVEQSLAGIHTIQDGRFLYVNSRFAEIFGYERPDELIGTSPLDLVHVDDYEKASEILRNRLSGEKAAPENFCLRGVKRDNEIVHVEIHDSRTVINKVPAIVGMVLDITKRVEDEKILQQLEIAKEASLAKNEFLSLATHELRAPLNGISGLAQTLRDAHKNGWLMQEGDMLTDFLDKILQSVFHMASLIDGLLEFSRIEAGKVDIRYEALDLRQALDIVKSNLSDKIMENELEFRVQLPPELPLVRAGLEQLTQILYNLIGNAVKYAGQKGVIIVRAAVEEAMILISVGDSGPGMDEESLKHVFEMFWRGDTVRTVTGTGLGLAISKKLVETMGGRIWAASELGAGSTFYFTLEKWRENGQG